MSENWRRLLERIRRDRRSGATVLLARGIEASRLFLAGVRRLPPTRLAAALERFTLGLAASQPAMATFLSLANRLWLAWEAGGGRIPVWGRLHDALAGYADAVDRGLASTIRRAAARLRSPSVVLTYSNSTAVRLALWRAMAAGKRLEVVCSESRPMQEGVILARRLATLGIPVHLTVDAALAEWIGRADVVLLGADAITPDDLVNKVGTGPLLREARRAGVPAYVLADSSKWLSEPLVPFWQLREEAPEEIARPGSPNLCVHNRYFGRSSLTLVTGVVWEGGVSPPSQIRRHLARLPVSVALLDLLEKGPRPAHGSGPIAWRRKSSSPHGVPGRSCS